MSAQSQHIRILQSAENQLHSFTAKFLFSISSYMGIKMDFVSLFTEYKNMATAVACTAKSTGRLWQ